MADPNAGKITGIRDMPEQQLIKIRCHSQKTVACVQEAANKALGLEKNPELKMEIHLDSDIPTLYLRDR